MAGDRGAPDTARYHTLDGLRGVAALLVAGYHLGLKTGPVVPEGYLAVDVFFALSGFVIALNYAGRLAAGLGAGRFVEARLVRLVPLYLLGLMLGLAKQAVGFLSDDPRTLRNWDLVVCLVFGLVMLPVPLPLQSLFPFNAASWSLFMELAVNVAFAIWLFRWRSRVLVGIVLVAGLVLALTVPMAGSFNVGWAWPNFGAGLVRTAFGFTIGILIFRHVPRRLRRISWWAPVPIAVVMAVMLFDPGPALRLPYEFAVVTLVFPAALVAGILLEMPPALRRTCGFLGDVSYPVYMIHWPLVPLAAPLLLRTGLGPVASATLFALLMLVLGALVARYYDLPVRAYASARLRLGRTAPSQVL